MDPRLSDGVRPARRLGGQPVNAFPHVNGGHYRKHSGLLGTAVVIGASGHGVATRLCRSSPGAAGGNPRRTFAVTSGQG
jgi:hypothetical protein